jgi:outer membrane protein
MKKFSVGLLLLIIGVSLSQAQTGQAEVKPLTLRDCFEMARNQSETLKIQNESIRQAKSRKGQAIGSVLPDIHWRAGVTWQDTNVSSASAFADDAMFRRRRTESRFTLDQPIFSGFKEFYAVRGFTAQARSAAYTMARTETELYQSVAAAFLNVIASETDLFNVRTTIKLSDTRLKELKDRVRIGRSRDSEIATAESQWAGLKANEAQILGNIAVAREDLGFLVGQDVSATPLVDNMGLPEMITKEEALKTAQERSDLKALREEVEARRDSVRVVQAAHWPWANLQGNYYTQRTGFLRDIDWDLMLNVDVPIFQGGYVKSQATEAKSILQQAKLALTQRERLVQAEIRQAQAALQASLQQAELLEEAYRRGKRSYDLQVKEYRYGLVTNLDVLQSLSSMQELKRNWDRSLIQSKLNYIQLLTATEQPFEPVNQETNQ